MILFEADIALQSEKEKDFLRKVWKVSNQEIEKLLLK